MLASQKDLFSLEPNVHYLNNAYMSPNLKSVEIAGIVAVKQKSRPYRIGIEHFFDPVKQLKTSFSKLVNAGDAERVAIVPSASYGLANVAKNIQAPRGSKILMPAEQFPSNYYVWDTLAKEKGYQIEIISPPIQSLCRGKEWNRRILDAIDDNTALLAIGHVHWADGTKFDLQAFRQKCDDKNCLLVVDGSQSIGALPFDIEEIRPDALVCVGYKWLFGPYGIGFAYYGEKFDQGKPIEQNWINRKNSENFKDLVNYQEEYKALANRYCVGENSNFVNTPMMQAALDQIHAWGVENIQAYSKNLIQPYLQSFMNMGFVVEKEEWRCNHLLGLQAPPDLNLAIIAKVCKEGNIHVSLRGNAIRLATSVYNTKRDLDQFYQVLHNNLALNYK